MIEKARLCTGAGLLPVSSFASGTNNVYISVSYDGKYIDDKNGNAIAKPSIVISGGFIMPGHFTHPW